MRSLLVLTALPEHPQGGGDLRNAQAARALAELGEVTVFELEAADPALAEAATPRPETLRWLADPLGHPGDRWFSERAAAELDELVERVHPDVVVLSQLMLHRYAPGLRARGCRVVLDTHDLSGPLHVELAIGRSDPVARMLAERTPLIEAKAFESVDQVWVCSDREAEQARALYPSSAPVAVVPNTIDVARYDGARSAAEPATLLYPGAFMYPPNARAAARLLDDIFPPFSARVDEARLVLLGRNPTSDMQAAAARDPRIELTGMVPDAVPYFARAGAMPVPLSEGGGTRLKVLEAFAAGVPVVSSAKGVEGHGLVAGEHYLEAESANEFVDALVSLCEDGDARATLVERARLEVHERFSTEAARRSIERAFDGLVPRSDAASP